MAKQFDYTQIPSKLSTSIMNQKPPSSLPYDPMTLARSAYDYTIGIPTVQTPTLPKDISSGKSKTKFTGAGANIFTALDALFAAGTAVTNQVANWTDGKADWKDIPLAESITQFGKGQLEAWKDGELGLKDVPIIGGLAAVTEKGKKGKDILTQLGVQDRPGKFDWGADVGGFVLDVGLDPLTYLTLGLGAVTKIGTKGVRTAAPLVAAKYGLKDFKAVGKNAEKIIENTKNAIINSRTSEYVAKGANPELAQRLAVKQADEAVNELQNVLNKTRAEAEKYAVFADLPFTEQAKGLIKRPSKLIRTEPVIGSEAGARVVAKLAEKGMTDPKKVTEFLSKKFEGITDPAQLTRSQSDEFFKRIESFPVPRVPNPKVTEKIMQGFPEVKKQVEEAVQAFKGKGKSQVVKPAATTAEEAINISREAPSFKDVTESKTYGEVADFVKANLTDISKGDASSLEGVIRSQFGVTRESARSMINQLRNDGILVGSKKPNVLFEVNKDALSSKLLTKSDIDKQISTSNDSLLSVARELASLGRISDTKNDKTVIESFIRAIDDGKGLTQKQIDNVRKRVSKYTGQLVGKVTSKDTRSTKEVLQSMQDRAGAGVLVQKTQTELSDLKKSLQEARKTLTDTKASVKKTTNAQIAQAKATYQKAIDDAKVEVNNKEKAITSLKDEAAEKTRLVNDIEGKIKVAEEQPREAEFSLRPKPAVFEKLNDAEKKFFADAEKNILKNKAKNATLSEKDKTAILQQIADSRQFNNPDIRLVYDSKEKAVRYKASPAEKIELDKTENSTEYAKLYEQFKQRALDEFNKLIESKDPVKKLKGERRTLKAALSRLEKKITKAESELTPLQNKLKQAKLDLKSFDSAGLRLSATASADAIKAAEENVAKLQEAVNNKQVELDALKAARAQPQNITEEIRQMVRPTQQAPAPVAKPQAPKRTATVVRTQQPVIKQKPVIQNPTSVPVTQQVPSARTQQINKLKNDVTKAETDLQKARDQLQAAQKLEADLRANPPKQPEVSKQTEAPPVTETVPTRTKAVIGKEISDIEKRLADAEKLGYVTSVKGQQGKLKIVEGTDPKFTEKLTALINKRQQLLKELESAPTEIKKTTRASQATDSAIKKLEDNLAQKQQALKDASNRFKDLMAHKLTVRVKRGEEYIQQRIVRPNVTRKELAEIEDKISQTLMGYIKRQKEKKPFKLSKKQQEVYNRIKTEEGRKNYFERMKLESGMPRFKMSPEQREIYNSLPKASNLPYKDRPRVKAYNAFKAEFTKQVKVPKYVKYYREKGLSSNVRYTPQQLRELSKLAGKEREDYLKSIQADAEILAKVELPKNLADELDQIMKVRGQLDEFAQMYIKLVDEGKQAREAVAVAEAALTNARSKLTQPIKGIDSPDIKKYNDDLAKARNAVLKSSDDILKLEKQVSDLQANLAKAQQDIPPISTADDFDFASLSQMVDNMPAETEDIIAKVMQKRTITLPTDRIQSLRKKPAKQIMQEIAQAPKLDKVDLTKPEVAEQATEVLTAISKALDETTSPANAVKGADEIEQIVKETPQLVTKEVEFIPRADASRIINSNFKAFSKDMVGKSKLYGFLSNNKYLNPRSLGLGHTLPETFGRDISKSDVKLYGRKYAMMKEIKAIQDMADELSADELDSIIYFMQKSYPNPKKKFELTDDQKKFYKELDDKQKQQYYNKVKSKYYLSNATEYFASRGIDADGVERIKNISIAMGKIFKKIGNEQQQAQLLGMLRKNYFPHVYKLSDGESEQLLLKYEDDPIVKQLMGRSQKDGFSNSRKSFQTLAEFDDYLSEINRKVEKLEAKPSLTAEESDQLTKLKQKYTDLSDVIERNPINALSRRYYKSIVSSTNKELINGLKTYGLIVPKAGKTGVTSPAKNFMQLDAQNAGLLGLKSGDYINRDIFNGLKKIEGMFTDEGINKFINEMNSIQNIWKQAVTTVIPKYYLTNFIGNVFNNSMAGVGINSYVEAGKVMNAMRKGTATPAQKQLIKQAIDQGVLYQGWLADFRTAADFKKQKDTGEKITDWIDKYFNQKLTRGLAGKYKRGLEKVGDITDDFSRFAHFIDQIGKTNSVELAADSVKKYLFNYREATRLDKFLRGSVFPFWMWTRNNVPLYLDKLLREPRFILSYFKLKRELQGGDLTPDDVPPWATEAGIVKGSTLYPTNLPINDLFKTMNNPVETLKDAGAMLNPALKMAIELPLNKQFYTGGMVAYPETQAQDYTRYFLQSLGGLGKLPADIFFAKKEPDILKSIQNLFIPVPSDLENFNK